MSDEFEGENFDESEGSEVKKQAAEEKKAKAEREKKAKTEKTEQQQIVGRIEAIMRKRFPWAYEEDIKTNESENKNVIIKDDAFKEVARIQSINPIDPIDPIDWID